MTVIGDGAVGLCAVLAAKRLGAERIISMGRHKDRTDLGREFGATDVVPERGEEGVERVRELTDANLDGTTLSGANLAMAKNLTQQQLDRARGDEDTKLPDGLQRPAHWSAAGGIASGPADE